jgi:methionine sulfoxide reductase heme-binding subunit
MKRSTRMVVKTLAWVGLLWPMAWLVYGAVTNTLGPDPTGEIADVTGMTALWMLAGTLAISPLRRLSPRLNWLIQFRRLLGLFVFFYACVHMLTWVALYSNFSVRDMIADVLKRRFIAVGMITFLLLTPLAATSTTWAIRKLGGRRWNRLHMLIYAAAITATIHYWWKVKTGVLSPAPFTVVIAILLLTRPVMAWAGRKRSKSASRQVSESANAG